MTYRRHPGADLAEAAAGLDAIDVLTALRFDELDCTLDEAVVATGYVNEAVANYSRVREENDAMRQRLTSCVFLLSQAGEMLGATGDPDANLPNPDGREAIRRLVVSMQSEIAAVAALSRKVESDV